MMDVHYFMAANLLKKVRSQAHAPLFLLFDRACGLYVWLKGL
jgi:hypothetical protein